MLANSQFNRQSSLQPQSMHSQQKSQQQNSLFSSYQANSNQWSNFKMNENNLSPFSDNNNSMIDDRITPFVPGQLWAGHGQSSIEDDPNCTPGSVSKPLLTETIDPESILSSLQRGNQWSNGMGDFSNSLLNNVGLSNSLNLNANNNNNNNMRGNVGSNQQQRGLNNSWSNSSGNNGMIFF